MVVVVVVVAVLVPPVYRCSAPCDRALPLYFYFYCVPGTTRRRQGFRVSLHSKQRIFKKKLQHTAHFLVCAMFPMLQLGVRCFTDNADAFSGNPNWLASLTGVNGTAPSVGDESSLGVYFEVGHEQQHVTMYKTYSFCTFASSCSAS